MKLLSGILSACVLSLILSGCGADVESSRTSAATALTIIICKATAADTKAQFIEHTHIRSSDEKEINDLKKKTKDQALKLCKRYSDQCSASCG